MPLSAGDKLGPYEILAPIGKGGMGAVYRARDPRLNRDVAIKISDERFTERFEREARAIASLNHPNICHLYDVGPNYLVMELVEGPTLTDRLKPGAIPLEESLNIAGQIADAIEAAHEKGITHRDLKPGNIKIKLDGTVKVLDFGLAKMGGTPTAQSDHSPTITMGQTEAGMILGTAAYMSPEQAKGKPVDQRADVYSFGVVLYEMVTGSRLHHGETTTEVLASVLKEEPRWDKVPPQVQRLLRRCLEKDPQKRQRHIGDVMSLLDEPPGGAGFQTATDLRPDSRRWLWPAAAGVIVIGAALALWAPWRSQPTKEAVRFEVGPAEKMNFYPGAAMAVSPDGHWMVFPASGEDGVTHYWLRSLDGVEVRALPGTEINQANPPASWSYDSRYVIFTSNATGARNLKRVDIHGGQPEILGDLSGALNGAAWNRDGVIVMGLNSGGPLLRMSASGSGIGPATVLEKGESAHRWPQLLPDGRHFIYHRASQDPKKMGVYIGSIDAKPEEQSLNRLLASDRQAYYAGSQNGSTGHLLFLRDATLMAQPFDPGKMELSGEPVRIVEGVDSYPNSNYGLFSVSDTGTLVYRAGGGPARLVHTWFDRQGNSAGTIGEPGDYANPAVSPDGTRVAVALGPVTTRDIWILDGRGTATQFTFDPKSDENPVWSPDGKSIVFTSNRAGPGDLYIKPADGLGEERQLFKSDEPKTPTSWSKDGRFLMFTSTSPKTHEDLWVLPMQGEAKPISVLATQAREREGQFSPDGRWIAYRSEESGSSQIYVRPFSPAASDGTSGPKWLVSRLAAYRPRWRADGKELVYNNTDLMAVDIDTSKGFQPGTPHRLFVPPSALPGWDLAPDGKRFLFLAPPGGGRTIPFTVVLNWEAGLKK